MIRKVLNTGLFLFILTAQITFWKLPDDDSWFADTIEELGSWRHSSPIWEQLAIAYGYIMQFFFLAIPSMCDLLHLPRIGPLSRGSIESLRAFLRCNLSPLDQYNETACSTDIDREGMDTLFRYIAHFDMIAVALSLVVINFHWNDVFRRIKAVIGEDV